MAAEEIFNSCARCRDTVMRNIALVTKLRHLLAVVLLSWLLGGALAAPTRQPGIQAWQKPCSAEGTVSADREPVNAATLQSQDELLNNHKVTMAQQLSVVEQTLIQLKLDLVDRLPNHDWVDELNDRTIEGMTITHLQHINLRLGWAEITRRTYELVARAYIYVDQMVIEEGFGALKQQLSDLRAKLKDDLMCPLHVYHSAAYGTGPLHTSTHSELQQVWENRSSTSTSRHNERNFMVVRDLKRITDHMTYQLYRPSS